MSMTPTDRTLDPTLSRSGALQDVVDVPPNVELFKGNSEMAGRMRALDWSLTPLGPVIDWPQSLRSAVSILLASKTQIILFWGPELVALYNDAYIGVFGSKHPWALGKPARECWAEIWDDTLGPLFAGVLQSGDAFHAQDHLFFFERQGFLEETYFDVSYDPVRVEGGQVGGIFCIVSERTERVLERRRLRTLRDLSARSLSEARSVSEACLAAAEAIDTDSHDVPFALIYDIAPDRKAARLMAARHIERGTPASPEEVRFDESSVLPLHKVVASNCPELVSADTLPELPSSPWGEMPRWVLLLPIRGRGRDDPAAILVAGVNPRRPLDEPYQTFLHTIAAYLSTAIASARAYEAERRRSEALAELDRAKTAFFSNVSHEFRTPLTLLLGPTEDLLSDPSLASQSRQQLEVVYRNSLRLLKLVNSLLDFSRLEAGRMEVGYEPMDVSRLTADIASSFRSAVEKAGMELRVVCPPVGEPVYLDRGMFEKIVLNLISNAFKFTFHGSIEVAVRSCEDHVELTVSDTGVGIPAEELPHIFDRFHRVKGVHGRTYEGTGIGLALVQELTKLHGGTVRADSVVEKGSTFTVSIPFGHAHLPDDRLSASRSVTPMSAASFVEEALHWLPGGPGAEVTGAATGDDPSTAGEAPEARILLADDNADMRQYVGRLLGTRYHVEVAADGLEALKAIERQKPDLILTDVMMAGLDGFGLLKKVRSVSSTRDIPCILLSARAGEESKIEGLDVGADDYLIKPFGARELMARVGVHLKLARTRKTKQQRNAADDGALTLLHQLVVRLASEGALPELLQSVCDAVITMSGAQKGTVQLYDAASSSLKLVAHRGFKPSFIDYCDFGHDVPEAAVEAMRTGARVTVDDVCRSSLFLDTSTLPALQAEGVVSLQATPFFARDGRLLGVISTYWDEPHHVEEATLRLLDLLAYETAQVVEHRQREGILRSSEEEFRALFEPGGAGMTQAEPETGRLIRVNETFARMLGYSPAELTGRSFVGLTHPDDRQASWEGFNRLLSGEIDTYQAEKRFLRRDGAIVWGQITVNLARDRDGRPLSTLAVVHDLTSSRAAEQAMRESEERFRKTFQHAATGIAITNLDGAFLRCNPAYCAITGYTSEELTRTKWHRIVHPQDRERNFLYIRRLMAGKLPSFEIESRYVQRSGEAVWVRKYVSLLRDEKGAPAHVLALVTNVTTRRQAEDALRRAHDNLEQRVSERTRELQQSEATLRALSAALLTAEEDERRRIARELHDDVVQQLALLSLEIGAMAGELPESSDHARSGLRGLQGRLVQVTRDLRRLSHGLHPSVLEELGLKAALEALCEESAKLWELRVHFEGGSEDVSLRPTVASVLYRIAQECMTNIAHHARARDARIELRRNGQLVELIVSDDGVGFDPAQTAGRGGLGLVGMRERVRLVNGSLSVTSWPGLGTSIRASVPIESGKGPPARASQ